MELVTIATDWIGSVGSVSNPSDAGLGLGGEGQDELMEDVHILEILLVVVRPSVALAALVVGVAALWGELGEEGEGVEGVAAVSRVFEEGEGGA